MDDSVLVFIFLFYGLAFFSMGLAITLEIGHGSDPRLKHALRPLAGFGFLHGLHEWIEMLELLKVLPGYLTAELFWAGVRTGLLAFSFLSLAAFGASLLAGDERRRRLSWLVPVVMSGIWGLGVLILRGQYTARLWDVADVWTRYSLAIPASILACAGLIALQREFRKAGMARFGRPDSFGEILVGLLVRAPHPVGAQVREPVLGHFCRRYIQAMRHDRMQEHELDVEVVLIGHLVRRPLLPVLSVAVSVW